MRTILATLLAVILSSCTVGPDYQRPSVDLPATFRHADIGTDEAQDVSLEWWKQFADPVLDALINEALAHNKNIALAATQVEAAAAVLAQSQAALYPQVNAQLSGARQQPSNRGTTPFQHFSPGLRSNYQALGAVNWTADFWGRYRRLNESARANWLASQQARRGVVLSLVAQVATSYLQLRAADAQLQIARRTLATDAQSLQLLELQFKHGQVSRMDVEQVRSQYQTAAVQIPPLETQIAQIENSLSLLLGRNPGAIVRGKTLDELQTPPIAAALPSQLLERRPDIMQAEANLVAANAQIGAAKAWYFPDISLTGIYGSSSSQLNNLFSGPARTWNFVGAASLPIFTGGNIGSQVDQAQAQHQGALLTYQQTIQNAFASVDNALVARQKLAEQLDAQQALVKSLQQYAHLAQLLFDRGYQPRLTVLNANQQLFPAELNLVQVQFGLLNAYVNLYIALGGGWVDNAEQIASQASSGQANNRISAK